jgi:hypothetical protein
MSELEKKHPPQVDDDGFKYYDSLPTCCYPCKDIKDFIRYFVTIDRHLWDAYHVKENIPYVLYSEQQNRYELYHITQFSMDVKLIPFMESSRLFLVNL